MNYQQIPDGSLPEYGGKCRCPVCGIAVHSWRVLFVGPSILSVHDWACDGCWNTWKREKRDTKLGKESLTGSEWLHDFMEDLGLDQSQLAPLREQADKSLDKLRDKLEKMIVSHPDPKYIALLAKVEAKKPKK